METSQNDTKTLTRIFAKYKLGMLEILFRRLDEPLPRTWGPQWLVEAYEWGAEQPPIGFCWCMVGPNETGLVVVYLKVFETDQRVGVGTALIAAARRRWPSLDLGGGATPEGAAFLKAYRNRVENGEEGAILVTDEDEAFAAAFTSRKAGRAGD